MRPGLACAADCPGLTRETKMEFAQQKSAKTIPAAVLDTLFRNSLRVGMVDDLFFAGFDSRLSLSDAPTYTPEAVPRKRSYSFQFPSITGAVR